MELKEGTSVFTPGGEEVGRVNRFVLDPVTNEVTHIVVQKGWLLPDDKILPFEMVSSSSDDRLVLNEEIDNYDELPPFEETHFVEVMDNDFPHRRTPADERGYEYMPAYFWYPAQSNVGFPGFGLVPAALPLGESTQNIPEGTVALREGTDIVSSDGEHVGNVDRLIVDSGSNKATHVVISQGLLFKDRKLVPAQWVKMADEEGIHLAVPARLLERLPAYQD